MNRRSRWYVLVSAVRWMACWEMIGMLPCNASLAEVRKETHTYKTVGELPIQAGLSCKAR